MGNRAKPRLAGRSSPLWTTSMTGPRDTVSGGTGFSMASNHRSGTSSGRHWRPMQ